MWLLLQRVVVKREVDVKCMLKEKLRCIGASRNVLKAGRGG